jgi:hypothetical protein
VSKVDVGLLVGIDVGRPLAPIQDEIDLPSICRPSAPRSPGQAAADR